MPDSKKLQPKTEPKAKPNAKPKPPTAKPKKAERPPSKTAIQRLIKALAATDAATRQDAANHLVQIGKPAVWPLIDALFPRRRPPSIFRQAIVGVLGKLEPVEPIPIMVAFGEALKDRFDDGTRNAILQAMCGWKPWWQQPPSSFEPGMRAANLARCGLTEEQLERERTALAQSSPGR